MTFYNTIVVEDEGPARRRLEKMVQEHPALVLKASLKSGKEAVIEIPKLKPDLLLLDIQLKDKTAFEVLDSVKEFIQSKIIFVTAYDQYAIKAFEIEAIDYLLKPYDIERFNKAIGRIVKNDTPNFDAQLLEALKKSLQKDTAKIIIPEGNKNHLFLSNDVIYIQSDKYYVYVHTQSEKRLIRVTLKKLEQILPQNFIRINKSTIVNTHYISQIEMQKTSSKIILSNNNEFYSSSNYYKGLRGELFK